MEKVTFMENPPEETVVSRACGLHGEVEKRTKQKYNRAVDALNNDIRNDVRQSHSETILTILESFGYKNGEIPEDIVALAYTLYFIACQNKEKSIPDTLMESMLQ